MKHFIDEKEVSEELFNEKLFGQCFIFVINNTDIYLDNKEIKKLYDQLSPLEKALTDNTIAKKEVEKYKDQTEFIINGYRFKREV